MEGKVRYKIDRASLQLEGNVRGIALFLLCFILYLRAITKYRLPRAYIRRGDLTKGFLRYDFDGLIFGGAYFRNFMVIIWRRDFRRSLRTDCSSQSEINATLCKCHSVSLTLALVRLQKQPCDAYENEAEYYCAVALSWTVILVKGKQINMDIY